jgi:uncharacterized protein YbaP (TraB family)
LLYIRHILITLHIFIFQMKFIRFCTPLFLLICFNFQSKSQTTKPIYNSLLWEISGPGMSQPSYLYGTMHVSKKIAFNLSDTFFIALKKVDVISLEFDPDTWMKNLADDGELLSQEPRYLNNSFSLYDVFKFEKIDEDGYKYFLSRNHNFANGLLYRNSKDDDFEENTYLDMFIFQAGKKSGKKLVGLEDHRFVRYCSYQAKQPIVGAKRSGRNYDYSFEEIEKAYRKGNLSALDSINELMYENTNFRKYMLDTRNQKMADKMDSIYKTGQSMFTGVGAAHLPGAMGIIELLRAKGYTVRAVNQKATDYSIQSRIAIEKKFTTITYNHQVSPDSLFEIDLPGEMYVINTRDIATEYFYPEMANGAYYSILKFNTFAPLFKKSIADQTTEIDELLYENIPGKILKKEITKTDAYSLITILNQTRKGDYQRYKIYIYPSEIIIGKLAGTGDFALGADGDRFIKSFNILDRSAKSTLQLKQLNINLGKGTLRENFSLYPFTYQSISKAEILRADSYNFLLSATYNDFNYIEEDSFELAYMTERFAKSIDYTLIKIKETNLKGYPLYEGVLTKKGAVTIHTRLLIKGSHYFLLGVMGKDSSNIDSYIESLKLNLESVEQAVVFSDTAFYYSTKTSAKAAAFNSKKSRPKPDINKNGIGDNYKYATQMIYFRDPIGNDKIELFYKQFNNYTYYENLDAFWNERMKNITNASLVIHSQKKSEKDSLFVLELELRDTNSIRTIYYKYYLKNSAYYCLSYNSDTLTKMTPFVSSFFDNFKITESYSNTLLFVKKKNIFFTDIHSNDSMRVNNAYNALMYMEFDKNDIMRLDSLINYGIPNAKFLKQDNIKSQCIKAISYIYDPTAIDYLKEAYFNNSDSIQVQAELLNALATNKSAGSYKCLQELLTTDVPYLSSYDVKSLFKSFYDSLELSVALFPKILHLTRYSNYRDNIYKLLSVLIDKGLIKKGTIVSNKIDIMNDANEEIKKTLSYKKKTYDSYSNTSYQSNVKSNSPLYDEIETYIILLSKIKKETNAKLFFSRIDRVTNKSLAMKYTIQMIHHDIPVADTVIQNFAKDEAVRADLYTSLKAINRLDFFNKTYINQADMTKCVLYSQSFILLESDSILFLEKRFVNAKGNKSGYVYFYKRYIKDRRLWCIDYIGLQPTDQNTFESNPIKSRKSQKLTANTDKEINTIIDESMSYFALLGRNRSRSNNYYKSYSGYNDNYDEED